MQDKYTIMLPKLHLNQRSLVRVSVYALMGCIAILILLRDLGGIGISRFVFIGLAALACILSNKAGIYCIIAFLTPLATGISCTYITAIALVILLFKQKKLYTQPIGLACMVGILVLELLSAFRGLFSLMDYLRFVGIFVFSFLRTFDTQDDYNNDGIVHGYILGFWVSMTSVWGQMLQSYSFSELLKLGVRFGNTRLVLDLSTEGMLISYNTNDLGCLCLLTAFFCLLLYQKKPNPWYLLSFVGTGILGIMTQSRTFILVYTLGIVFYMMLSCHSVITAVKNVLALLIGGTAVVGAAMWLIPEYIESFLLRFQDADISNGRIDIANYYFNEMFQHTDRALFGVGLQNYQDKYGTWISAHNAIQETMIAWGALGLLLVAILLFALFWNAHMRNPKAKWVQYLPLVLYLLAIQAGQGFSDMAGMLRIMVAYSAIQLSLRGETHHSIS